MDTNIKTTACTFCDSIAELRSEIRQVSYRKEDFTINELYYVCPACNEEFTTNEIDSISIAQVHNQYRERLNILFAEEITAIRNRYQLSSLKMSQILGLGVN